ncbi:MAG: hypothetical protein V3T86_07160 [Planctomycetota bacterium]
MATWHVIILILGIAAFFRDLAVLPALFGYVRGARVRDIEKEATPRMRLLVQAAGGQPGLEENVIAALRQNYPPFQARFLHDDGDSAAANAIRAAQEAVTDLAGDVGAPPRRLAAVSGGVRPDPLFLRDIAHSLAEAEWVGLPTVLIGAKGRGAQLLALTVNVDLLAMVVMGDGRWLPTGALGTRAGNVEDEESLAEHLDDGLIEGPGEIGRRPVVAPAPTLATLTESRDEIAARMRPLKALAPVLFHLWGVHSMAPALLLLATPSGGGWATIILFGLLLLTRLISTVLVDARLCRDLSTIRALAQLPFLWFVEPAAYWVAWRSKSEEQEGEGEESEAEGEADVRAPA